ncbi:MAG: cytochrome C [Desulfuromonadaceae bacterium]|nr:cytochrome C [Desulfuromonadaceae bacterium]
MKIDKRDWMFIAIIVVVLGIFIGISGKEKTKTVPNNPMHKISYDAAFKNAPGPDASIFQRAFYKPDKKGAEVYCEPCHKEMNVPFPPGHPAKNRCMFCHKFKR